MGAEASLRFVGRSAERPIVLSGPPQRLAGLVHLGNPGEGSLVLRHLVLSDTEARLGGAGRRHKLRPVVLRAAEERAVELAIGLDAATPPGEYRVELEVSGERRPAILYVAETVALRLEPAQVVVLEAADRPAVVHVVAMNEGNVPVTIDRIAPVELHDDTARWRPPPGAVGALLDDAGDAAAGDVVALLLALVPARGPAVARAAIALRGGPVRLEPGEAAGLALEIETPAGLAGSRLRGRAAILTADLEVVLIPAGERPASGEPEPPARRPAAGSPRRAK